MAAAAEVQALLRFLTQDVRVPLAAALPKVGELRKAHLRNAEDISKANLADIRSIFTDEKLTKQVLNAAKRVTNPKKRAKPDTPSASADPKRAKSMSNSHDASFEMDLVLPTTSRTEEELAKVIIQTNRAPLVLAFAVTVLKYTMPEQPLSSRLSLAQAVVSANSQSKAKSIGLTSEKTAEDEGWAMGQPKARVMGREVAVMRRATHQLPAIGEGDSQATLAAEEGIQNVHESFWGLDLEALRKSNGPLVAGKNAHSSTSLPIHSPQPARSYLLKSFVAIDSEKGSTNAGGKESTSQTSPTKKRANGADMVVKREEAAAMVLKAVDLVCESWAPTLTKEELDRRAWSWYLHVRPEVAQGQAGWGQRGHVRLEEILKLSRVVE